MSGGKIFFISLRAVKGGREMWKYIYQHTAGDPWSRCKEWTEYRSPPPPALSSFDLVTPLEHPDHNIRYYSSCCYVSFSQSPFSPYFKLEPELDVSGRRPPEPNPLILSLVIASLSCEVAVKVYRKHRHVLEPLHILELAVASQSLHSNCSWDWPERYNPRWIFLLHL